jgi:hypothetical protein
MSVIFKNDRNNNFNLLLPRLLPDLTVYMSKTTGVLLEAGTAYPSRAPQFTPGVLRVHVARSSGFCVLFCRLLFLLLSFYSVITLFVLLSFYSVITLSVLLSFYSVITLSVLLSFYSVITLSVLLSFYSVITLFVLLSFYSVITLSVLLSFYSVITLSVLLFF